MHVCQRAEYPPCTNPWITQVFNNGHDTTFTNRQHGTQFILGYPIRRSAWILMSLTWGILSGVTALGGLRMCSTSASEAWPSTCTPQWWTNIEQCLHPWVRIVLLQPHHDDGLQHRTVFASPSEDCPSTAASQWWTQHWKVFTSTAASPSLFALRNSALRFVKFYGSVF